MEHKEKITLDEFKAWLTGLIVGKRGALPDVKDWKKIKQMLDKVEPETVEVPVPAPSDPLPITPPMVPGPYDPTPYDPYRWPQPDPYWSPNTLPYTVGDPIPNPSWTGDPPPTPNTVWCSGDRVDAKSFDGWVMNGEYKDYSVQVNMEDFIPENAFSNDRLDLAIGMMGKANT